MSLIPFLVHPLLNRWKMNRSKKSYWNPELRSPTLALLEDLAQDIPHRHSTWVRSISAHLLDYYCYTTLAILHVSHTYREASTDPLWQIAMKEELDALSKNHTWDLVTLLLGKSMAGCKWIYKIKLWWVHWVLQSLSCCKRFYTGVWDWLWRDLYFGCSYLICSCPLSCCCCK